MRLSKKAALSISIEAIVIIVIAFVVLGLGLTLTKTIFFGAQEMLPGVFDLTKLEQQPTSENPLIFSKTVEITRNKQKTMDVGYYNKDISTHLNVSINIKNCQPTEEVPVTNTTIPVIKSLMRNVPGSTGVGFVIVLKERGLSPGIYLCNVVAEGPDPITGASTEWEVKQITLQVTT